MNAPTLSEVTCYTDEHDVYNRLQRIRHMVCHGPPEWARDDGNGIREMRVNTNEVAGMVCVISCHCYRGVHKAHLSGYAAIHELAVNHKYTLLSLVSKLIHFHLY